MTPTFSIIIPVYNVAPYLRECLDSVLAQTCTGWEAICVDDGSTDGSGAILDEYAAKDRRFRVIHQANAGSSAARNVGLDSAVGEWIWFVDSDDFIETGALDAFARLENKADVTYFSMRVRYADGMYEEKHLANVDAVIDEEKIDALIQRLYGGCLGDVFGWTVDKFIRREVVSKNRIRFDETISFYEDEVFTIRVMEHIRSLATISDVFYNYRRLDSGLTAKGIPEPYTLAQAFLSAGGKSHRNAICKLVDTRVTTLLRSVLHKEHRLAAAKLLLNEKRVLLMRSENGGTYNKVMRCLLKLPVPVASIFLLCFHLIKK